MEAATDYKHSIAVCITKMIGASNGKVMPLANGGQLLNVFVFNGNMSIRLCVFGNVLIEIVKEMAAKTNILLIDVKVSEFKNKFNLATTPSFVIHFDN